MIITRDHIIFDVLEILRSGGVTDDEFITPAQVGFWVDNTRALLIERDISKGRAVNIELVQTLPCESVVQVDSSECGCTATGCFILRTENQIPAALDVRGLPLITRIASPQIDSPAFAFMSHERAIWTGSSKFTKNVVKCFMRNGYIYFISKRYFNKVSISGVFAAPMDLGSHSTCSGVPCYTNDSKYPVNASLIEEIKSVIKSNNLEIVLKTRSDSVNNADGEITTPGS
jgi:hypothetical protein